MEHGDSNLIDQISAHVAKGLQALNGGSVLAGTLENRLLHHPGAFKSGERKQAQTAVVRARSTYAAAITASRGFPAEEADPADELPDAEEGHDLTEDAPGGT